VVFDKPRYAEVQLKITVSIRGDILLEPSGLDYGEVEQGAEASRTLTVTHFGNADWEIIDVLANTEHIECELGERVRSGSRVSYPLTAKLNARMAAGSLGTQLMLVTNDPGAEKIPVMVEGSVRPLVSVAPASLYLGSLRPGQSISKRLVVRAPKPFHIEAINTDCDCFDFSYATGEAKTLHLVPVILAEGHIHRSLGQRPRDRGEHPLFGRRPYSPCCVGQGEYGLRPNRPDDTVPLGHCPRLSPSYLRIRTTYSWVRTAIGCDSSQGIRLHRGE